jgi:hypothetical protein
LVPLKVIRHSQYQKDKKDVKDDAPPVASSYAFVKYTDEADAVASKKLITPCFKYRPRKKCKVELASAAAQKSHNKG